MTERSKTANSLAKPRKSGSPKREVSQSYWAAEQGQVESDVAETDRLRLFRQHGDFSLAYSTAVQPRLSHFGDSAGYIAHRSRWGVTCGLGDPVCSKGDRRELIRGFVEANQRPFFCQVSHVVAAELASLGYYVNSMGVDTELRLDEYNFSGKSKEWLRYAANWIRRRDFKIEEASFADVTPGCVEMISEAWRATRTVKQKEVRFLNRPIVLHDEPDVRKFFLSDAAGKVLAFVFLDPLCRDGKVVGYVTSFKRRHPESPQYSEQAMMKHIIETLQHEGVQQLKLGLSPLAEMQPSPFRSSRTTDFLLRAAFDSRIVNRRVYHLAGHASYKSRFHGAEEQCYLAMPGRFSPRRLFALLTLSGIA